MVESIKFWGIPGGKLTVEDVDKISSPRDSILHLLRHFDMVPNSWIERMMLIKLTTEEFIREQLKMPGSKWNPQAGLATPEDVITLCQNLLGDELSSGRELRWLKRGQMDFCFSSRLLSAEMKAKLLGFHSCHEPLGKSGLILREKVPKSIEVVQRFNRGGIVNIAFIDDDFPIPDADNLVIALNRKETGVVQVFSAFPGILTPPVPRQEQDPREYGYNKSWWSKYCLIERRSQSGAKSCSG